MAVANVEPPKKKPDSTNHSSLIGKGQIEKSNPLSI